MSRSQGAANGGWQQRRPAAEPDPRTGRPTQPPRGAQPGVQQGQPAYPEQQTAPPAYGGQPGYYYPQTAAPQPGARQGLSNFEPTTPAQPAHDFDNYPATQPPFAQQTRPAGRPQTPAIPAYRPPMPQYAPQSAPPYEQWPAQTQDPHAYDLGGYMPAAAAPGYGAEPGLHVDPLQQQADWALPANDYGEPPHAQPGFAPQGYEAQHHAGALEPTYGHEEGAEYEGGEPRRGSWTMRIAGAIVVAIGLGYGLAQAYKMVLGTTPDGAPPVIQSDATPPREKPVDPGGKQFSHTDSKVLGRLGDGGAEQGSLSQSDTDGGGARKVTTVTVGRDGSIAPPEPPAAPEPAAAQADPSISVPGLTVVDAFGSAAPPQHSSTPPAAGPTKQAEAAPATPEQPVVVNTPSKRVNVKSTKVVPPAETASTPDEAAATPAPPAAKKPAKVAAAEPAAETPAASSSGGANGYVVVLASVPASGTSRLDALKKFADMQQQYGTVLANKTPDVQEANLGEKGVVHRLLVGPPGSRAQASTLCSELKTAGYTNCWVKAY